MQRVSHLPTDVAVVALLFPQQHLEFAIAAPLTGKTNAITNVAANYFSLNLSAETKRIYHYLYICTGVCCGTPNIYIECQSVLFGIMLKL